MAGSFGGARSADRLRRLSRVSARSLHSQPKTSNEFLEIIGRFSRNSTGLAIPGRGKIWAAWRGAPRLGMPGTMAAVTGQSPSPDAPQGLSVLEAVLARITYVNKDTGYTISPGWPPGGPARIC
jgi:hypothetical protein